jgi:hypothetical protein
MWLAICEAKDREILESTKFGPKIDENGTRLSLKESRDTFMKEIDELR